VKRMYLALPRTWFLGKKGLIEEANRKRVFGRGLWEGIELSSSREEGTPGGYDSLRKKKGDEESKRGGRQKVPGRGNHDLYSLSKNPWSVSGASQVHEMRGATLRLS